MIPLQSKLSTQWQSRGTWRTLPGWQRLTPAIERALWSEYGCERGASRGAQPRMFALTGIDSFTHKHSLWMLLRNSLGLAQVRAGVPEPASITQPPLSPCAY